LTSALGLVFLEIDFNIIIAQTKIFVKTHPFILKFNFKNRIPLLKYMKRQLRNDHDFLENILETVPKQV